jgi:transcriptional regulator with XRE-family HTH domain
MSRQNPMRSVGGEANLARRIERERTLRAWSYEKMAKELTAIGCSIQGSAIYKIEHANPPRRITVDELVALARVFDTTVEDLLTPIEVLDQQRAQDLLKDLDRADTGLLDAIDQVLKIYGEFFIIRDDEPELFDYVFGHHYRRDDIPADQQTPLLRIVNEVYARLLAHAEAAGDARIDAEGVQA